MTVKLGMLRALIDRLSAGLADDSLETLLTLMKWSFDAAQLNDILIIEPFPALEGFHKNLMDCVNGEGFKATYLFKSADDKVQASAVFHGGDMKVLTHADDNWDIGIVFQDVPAFWRFLFSGGKDILTAVLDNEVSVYGNLNYLYKFGFMARDLGHRLGLDLVGMT
jgi:hypothetical protein